MFQKTLLLIISAATVLANAESKDPVFLLGQNESLLHISATEQREVEQDLIIARLHVEKENKNSSTLQNEINSLMTQALDLAKKESEVKTSTLAYQLRQHDENAGRRSLPRKITWKGRQALQLKSKDSQALLQLAGKIQELGFVMKRLDYTLSPERRAQVHDDMLEAALKKLENRAQRAMKALGKKKSELKQINTQSQQGVVNYGAMEMEKSFSLSSAMAAPVAAAGETQLSLTVSAKAILSD